MINTFQGFSTQKRGYLTHDVNEPKNNKYICFRALIRGAFVIFPIGENEPQPPAPRREMHLEIQLFVLVHDGPMNE